MEGSKGKKHVIQNPEREIEKVRWCCMIGRIDKESLFQDSKSSNEVITVEVLTEIIMKRCQKFVNRVEAERVAKWIEQEVGGLMTKVAIGKIFAEKVLGKDYQPISEHKEKDLL
jgi:hypothetical protein